MLEKKKDKKGKKCERERKRKRGSGKIINKSKGCKEPVGRIGKCKIATRRSAKIFPHYNLISQAMALHVEINPLPLFALQSYFSAPCDFSCIFYAKFGEAYDES